MYAKKSLGQHFLRSEKALKQIVDAGELSDTDTILEIGPGHGVLTERLLATGAHVIAVEKDDQLFESLKNKFSKAIATNKLTLIHEDILDYTPFNQGYKLIANIPYNITGKILEKFLSDKYQPLRMVLLVQKEVAERIVARDNKESILSISVKVYGTPKYIDTVKAGSFVPAPQVDSAIIVIENISKNFFAGPHHGGAGFSEEKFFEILNAGFKSKRKKLSSNLSVIFGKILVKNAFQKLNLDENVRAEDINLEIWQKLTQKLLTFV